MSKSIVCLPSGYVVTKEQAHELKEYNIHAQLHEWMTKYMNGRAFTIYEQFEIISLLKKLSIMDGYWFQAQLLASNCYGPARILIVDTLSFVLYGQARIHEVLTLGTVIDVNRPDDRSKVDAAVKSQRNEFKDSDAFCHIIEKWVSKPNGFNDMICTMHVLINGPVQCDEQGGFFLNTQS